VAYNYGRSLRARGVEIAYLSALLPQARPLNLNLQQLDALQRLGDEGFRGWAVRGWYSNGV
jgi:hypothetical protein